METNGLLRFEPKFAVVCQGEDGKKYINSLHVDGFSAHMDACNTSSKVYSVRGAAGSDGKIGVLLGEEYNYGR